MAAPQEDIVLASAVSNVDFIKVFDQMVRDRYNNIDLSALLTYLIDLTPSANLYWLAKQFDVLSAGEFDLCDTDQEQRNLIKNAINLHKTMGTPYAITNALLACGFANVVIKEGTGGAIYDGTYEYNGSVDYGAGSWAEFTVQILDLGETKGWGTAMQELVIQVIDKYKRAVCRLVGIYLYASVVDNETENDDNLYINARFADVDTFVNFGIEYDGQFEYDGSQTYGNNTEVLEFVMTPLLDTVPQPDQFNGDYENFVTTGGFVISNPYELELVSTSSARYAFAFVPGVEYIISFIAGTNYGSGDFEFCILDNYGNIITQAQITSFTEYVFTFFNYEGMNAAYISFSFRTNRADNAYVYGLTIEQVPTLGLDILSIDDSNFSINIVPSDQPTINNEDSTLGPLENENGDVIYSE